MKTLRGLTAIFLGLRLIKTQQMSNWECAALTESQIHYASADAWVSMKVYSAMLRYGDTFCNIASMKVYSAMLRYSDMFCNMFGWASFPPPPVFDHLQYPNIEGWESAVTSVRQRVDTAINSHFSHIPISCFGRLPHPTPLKVNSLSVDN